MPDRFLEEDAQSTNWRLRISLALATVFVIVLSYALIYRWAMAAFANEQISLIHSIRVVVEILTTAGFGGDTAAWEHDVIGLMVLLMNISGVLFVFLAIPLFAVPMFRQALDTSPPTTTDLTDHVIICGHSAMDDVLRDELESAGRPYLFVDSDPEEVTRLIETGEDAIYGNAERVQTLQNANAEQATALVADLDDETNPTVILSAARVNPDMKIVSVTDTHEAVPHHRYAGADEVVISKESLGESLAMRAMKTVSERFQDAINAENGDRFQEYLVVEGSQLVGKEIREVDLFPEQGITVIGGWFGAKFLVSPPPQTVIQENSILLVSGAHEALEGVGARQLPSHHGHPSRVVVAGYGDVGRAAAQTLEEEDIATTIVDSTNMLDVDVVGDITTRQTLIDANLDDARSIILAVDNDATAIYSSIIIKQVEPDIEVIARANDEENVWKLYNAGADYVLSLPSVTGEILAATLIDKQTILTPHDEFEFTCTEAPAVVGQTLVEADLRNKTGCTVVGVERNNKLLTNLEPSFTIESDDILIAAGAPSAIDEFRRVVKKEE